MDITTYYYLRVIVPNSNEFEDVYAVLESDGSLYELLTNKKIYIKSNHDVNWDEFTSGDYKLVGILRCKSSEDGNIIPVQISESSVLAYLKFLNSDARENKVSRIDYLSEKVMKRKVKKYPQ